MNQTFNTIPVLNLLFLVLKDNTGINFFLERISNVVKLSYNRKMFLKTSLPFRR